MEKQKNNPVHVKETLHSTKSFNREWKEEYDLLAKKALAARKNSYSPYSHFEVGAALLTKSGKIFTGCNIENAAYSVVICAERTAMSAAIANGHRDFEAIMIVAGPSDKNGSIFATPCGMCRQYMREFCRPDFPIILIEADEKRNVTKYKVYRLDELLVDGFGPEDLL